LPAAVSLARIAFCSVTRSMTSSCSSGRWTRRKQAREGAGSMKYQCVTECRCFSSWKMGAAVS